MKNFLKWYWSKIKESNAKLRELSIKKCPKCDSTDLNYVRPKINPLAWMGKGLTDMGKLSVPILLIPDMFKAKEKSAKTLNVCRSCGFSWEDK